MPAMKALLAAGALVDLPNIYGHTPLIVAAGATRGRATPTRGGNYTEEQAIEAVKLLLAAGANVNAAAYGSGGKLPRSAPRPCAALATWWSRTATRERPPCTARRCMAGCSWQRCCSRLARIPIPLDADGKTPLDYAMGRYRLGFLENAPEPQLKVAAALRALGAKKETADAPAVAAGCRARWSVAEVPVVPY